tara:strand:- start:345 stop:1073 length:729 start_codon:yes stop_codon:yes gene_type:complete
MLIEEIMTKLICHENSYIKEFDAKVTSIRETGIILDKTAFYPGGGGQPADKGSIIFENSEYTINGIVKEGENYIHKINSHNIRINETVRGIIDWENRYNLMRTHTALHILCGVIWRDYKALVTGGDMKPLSARMDFELDTLSSEFAKEVEESVNKEVQNELDIEINIMEREEAFKIPDLIRTKINLLPDSIQQIRTVNITGLDLQADGGTHVNNTKEVGKIIVIGHESKGKINKRLRIKVEN